MRNDVLYLDSNSWTIARSEITDDTGATVTDLTARCFFCLGEIVDGELVLEDDPIHGSLDNAAVPITAGKLRAVFSGTLVSEHVGLLLDVAELAGEELDIYERVIVPGSYGDHHRVRVERNRPAGSN